LLRNCQILPVFQCNFTSNSNRIRRCSYSGSGSCIKFRIRPDPDPTTLWSLAGWLGGVEVLQGGEAAGGDGLVLGVGEGLEHGHGSQLPQRLLVLLHTETIEYFPYP
jgi:hypothetical protein